MKCHHCQQEKIEKFDFYNEFTFPNQNYKYAFCSTICFVAGMLDDLINNPNALTHIDKKPWIPVLQQFHDEILK